MIEKTLNFRNLSLCYYDSESDLPVLLFCHANGYSAGCYKTYFQRFQSKYRIIAIDFIGHGKSEFSIQFENWRFFRDQVIAVIEKENLEDVTAIGHSLGGASILLASAKKPKYFRKLLVLDPVVLGWKLLTLAKFLGNPLARGAAKRRKDFPSIDLVRRAYRKFPAFANFDPNVFEDYLDSCFVKTEGTKEVSLRCDPRVETRIFSFAHYNVFLDYYKIKTETHVLIPDPWEVCSPKLAKLITKKNPNSSVTIRQNYTHFFPFENPNETYEWLVEKIG
ncbi:alpha/beta hydrolase [Leptospira sp. 96542]|nr:alpha/beta hydrolase [Leptospira sp. 96542]